MRTETGEIQDKCTPFLGWEKVVEQSTSHIVIFGEMHGTNESPAAVTGVLCEIINQQTPIKFGIEAFHDQSEALNEALAWPIDTEILKSAGPNMWRVPDGRSSEAIYRLLEQIALWKSLGAEIEVFAFDSTFQGDDAALSRANVMSRQVDAAARDFDGAIIVLAGGYHISLNPIGSPYQGGSLASEVRERPVLAIDMAHDGGEAYVTATFYGGDKIIGASYFKPTNLVGGEPNTFVLSSDDPRKGKYFVGTITPSPPAFPELVSE